MRALPYVIAVCLLFWVLLFSAVAKSVEAVPALPVVQMDAWDAPLKLPDGSVAAVCIIDYTSGAVKNTSVYLITCGELVPMLMADQQRKDKTAVVYLTINGHNVNLT